MSRISYIDKESLLKNYYETNDIGRKRIKEKLNYMFLLDKEEELFEDFKKDNIFFKEEILKNLNIIYQDNLNINLYLDAYKLYKILFLPDYNIPQTLMDLNDTFSSESPYDENYFEEFDGCQLKQICKAYLRKYGRIPNLDFKKWDDEDEDNIKKRIDSLKVEIENANNMDKMSNEYKNKLRELENLQETYDDKMEYILNNAQEEDILEAEEVDSNIKAIKIDTDKFDDLAREYGIMSIPTLVLLEKGKEVKRNIGFIGKEQIETFFEVVYQKKVDSILMLC